MEFVKRRRIEESKFWRIVFACAVIERIGWSIIHPCNLVIFTLIDSFRYDGSFVFVNRLAFYADLAVIALTASLIAKIGVYITQGKVGGALPLPERRRIRERKAREAREAQEAREVQEGPAVVSST